MAKEQQPIIDFIWNEKYRFRRPDGTPVDATRMDSLTRVAYGIFDKPDEKDLAATCLRQMAAGDWMPAGRIHAGAGTDKRVTLINCFVSPTIEDSMASDAGVGIMDALKDAALTQQMGGGIGMDFSSLRPNGAVVKRTGSVSTGVLPFMDMYHAMCSTVMSSGSRRGAMMATLRVDHPDVEAFIRAKRQEGRLSNFNVSVLITDDFMEAVDTDKDWELFFSVPKADGTSTPSLKGYVYKTIKARKLWDDITKLTYEFAEPGVIFIDRVNSRNNLYYCEKIASTNPCGEQPLPPNGACNLGAINLANMVIDPFTDKAHVDWLRLESTAALGMEFLDRVLDHSRFPTKAQAEESRTKRRTGLGVSGLANMLMQLQLPYASPEARRAVGEVMKKIRDTAYQTSVAMAARKGPFPLFEREKYLDAAFIKLLPTNVRAGIWKYGIRNSVLLTVAPVGTTSLYYGNISSGVEPVFALSYTRKVKVLDAEGKESFREFRVVDRGMELYEEAFGTNLQGELPDYMATALDLPVEAHILMQAEVQKWVDSSISKTINCPEDMTFEEFKAVYSAAYENGLKGCTTYRPSKVRGAVLVADSPKVEKAPTQTESQAPLLARPDKLHGTTYKIKWVGVDQSFYVTINDLESNGVRRPFELFINSKSVQHMEWIAALTRTISAVFRRGGDLTFLVDELVQVHSTSTGQWEKGKYIPSLVAAIGRTLETHFQDIGLMPVEGLLKELTAAPAPMGLSIEKGVGETCPSCAAPSYVKSEGCGVCKSCGYSSCS
jgi:ribonucleoside-diphosphate reductase alpha chain